MGILILVPFFRFSDEITADDNDVKFKQWNGRERSLYFEPRYRVTGQNGKNLPLTLIWDVPPSCLGSR